MLRTAKWGGGAEGEREEVQGWDEMTIKIYFQ